jgi:hypothetical protein
MRGICRLHGEEAELMDSHILPRWAWRRAIQSDATKRVGHVSRGTFTDTGEQVKEPLLCSSCEQRLGVWDEYASQVSRQLDGSFPARDRSLPIDTNDLSDGVEAIVDASALNLSDIATFAASVVWRASVSSKCEARLGPKYEEEFARYLRGCAQFPACGRLFLYLIDPKGTSCADEMFALPKSKRVDVDRSIDNRWAKVRLNLFSVEADAYNTMHEFVVFGMHFMLLVGARLPRDGDDYCLVRTGRAWIGLPQGRTAELWKSVLAATPKGDRATRMWRK